ncbi:MAG: flavodoxin domain-containing protein [Anaerolineales bacterium]|jgi:hypothetical protein|nr:flavodoxin domain-containing protein [Anaerolineales bacterium]
MIWLKSTVRSVIRWIEFQAFGDMMISEDRRTINEQKNTLADIYRSGSTVEIARAIAKTLSAQGAEVDLLPV